MWDPHGEIIQIELGPTLLAQLTSKDNRSLFGKLVGQEKPTDGDQFSGWIKHVRSVIKEKTKLDMPGIQGKDNPSLAGGAFILHIGLETIQNLAKSPEEMFTFVANSFIDYGNNANNFNSLDDLLSSAVSDARNGDYQQAYKKYSVTYFFGFIQKNTYFMARSSSEASAILAMTNIDRALSITLPALELSDKPEIVDPILKTQIGINAGGVFRIAGQLEKAEHILNVARFVALKAQQTDLIFMVLVEYAGVLCAINNFGAAIEALEQADKLLWIEDSNPNYVMSGEIQKEISNIKSILINDLTKKLDDANKKIRDSNIQNRIYSILSLTIEGFARAIGQSVAYKVFGINGAGGMSLFSVGKLVSVNDRDSVVNVRNMLVKNGTAIVGSVFGNDARVSM